MTEFKKIQRSPLLVIGVGGRIGAGTSFVRDKILQSLSIFDYEVEIIDVSEVILENAWEHSYRNILNDEAGIGALKDAPSDVERVKELQRRGNKLRNHFDLDIIAVFCVIDVIYEDIKQKNIVTSGTRYAYIIDSLKHPAEVEFLRYVFGEAFYMVGVVASDATRAERLSQRKGFGKDSFVELSRIDADEDGVKYGQKAVSTVLESDYFFANNSATKATLLEEADRFLRLIFDVDVETPRQDEYGMNVAVRSSTRSACLSRQVGAAIFSPERGLLATGRNDVPRFGGGLYDVDCGQDDKRCWTMGAKCYNDHEKKKIVQELVEISCDVLGREVENEKKEKLEKRIRLQSRVKSLIEFSRAVHAEMDAIVTIARNAIPGLPGSTIYCTTYPCHNCAKHIIDAGVVRVVYLEPYEKSLAGKLHSDVIQDPLSRESNNKVRFEIFGGVAPRRYQSFFGSSRDRKKDGQYLDRDRERRVLTPQGAQEVEVLMHRLEKVNDLYTPKKESNEEV